MLVSLLLSRTLVLSRSFSRSPILSLSLSASLSLSFFLSLSLSLYLSLLPSLSLSLSISISLFLSLSLSRSLSLSLSLSICPFFCLSLALSLARSLSLSLSSAPFLVRVPDPMRPSLQLQYAIVKQPILLLLRYHPGGDPGADRKSISHRCHLILVGFVFELTDKTINFSLGCLQGGYSRYST